MPTNPMAYTTLCSLAFLKLRGVEQVLQIRGVGSAYEGEQDLLACDGHDTTSFGGIHLYNIGILRTWASASAKLRYTPIS